MQKLPTSPKAVTRALSADRLRASCFSPSKELALFCLENNFVLFNFFNSDLLQRLRSIVMSLFVSVCVSVREDVSGTTRAIFTNSLCMLPMSVARSSSGMLTIGRIAYWREGVTGVHSAGEV